MKTKWYLANLIEFPIIRDKISLKIINFKRPMYWDNLVLISATNSQMAYKKAIKYGKEGEDKTINTDGNYLEWKFAGVRELVEIYEELEDGGEIAYFEGHCNSFKKIRKQIPPKNKLSVFEFEKRIEKEKKQIKRKERANSLSSEELEKKRMEAKLKARKVLGNINKNI
jgi:hypothetical protein